MEQQAIVDLIYEWQAFLRQRTGTPREIEPRILASLGSRPIKIISGFRRSGKSFLTQRLARLSTERDLYALSNILYLNFEDFRLAEINSPERVSRVYELFRAQVAGDGPKLVILDEVQLVQAWDRFVRTIYERDEDVEIILTGSNSELLSSELSSRLSGRYLEYTVLPFSFREFLSYRGASIADEAEYRRARRDLSRMFSEYASSGGLPEALTIADPDARRSYHQGVLSKVILDDIVKRFGVSNVEAFERLVAYVYAGVGTTMSYARLRRLIADLGISTKPETIISYLQYLRQAFAVFEVNRFDWKLSRVFSTSRKFYAIDPGLLSLYRRETENYALRLENIVFLELCRQGRKIHFGADEKGKEIDFLVPASERQLRKLQVCLSLTEANVQRELGNLAVAAPYLQAGPALLLTLEPVPEGLECAAREADVTPRELIHWLVFGDSAPRQDTGK